MNNYDVKRLILAYAIQAEIEGMKALNRDRESNSLSQAYDESSFLSKAEELNTLAHNHDELL